MLTNKSTSAKIFNLVNYTLIIVFLVVIVYPLWYVLCASFSDVFKVNEQPFLLWPIDFTLESYELVFEYDRIWIGFRNSFLYMIVGTCLNIAMTLLSAYPLSRESMPGKKIISRIIILSMYISGGMIPLYLIVDGTGIRDTMLAMILPNAVSVYFILISISFLKSIIPEGIQEAARIDGAGYFKTFMTIVIPLSTPLIGVLALQYGLAHWNSYTQAMIYLDNVDLFPLQLILREILIKADSSMVSTMLTNQQVDYVELTKVREGFKYASIIVSSAPLLFIYPFLRKHFDKGLLIGGIKE